MQRFILKHILFFVIVVLAFSLRMYRITYPILDWHSFRQADTASVTKEYIASNLSEPLIPQYHDLSNIQSGKDNLAGYRMVEFPILNILTAAIALTFPGISVSILSRLISVLFSLGALTFLFSFTKQYFGSRIAHVTALMFAILPYSIFYSRAVLPEPSLLFFSVGALWLFGHWLKTESVVSYLLSSLFLVAAFLLKPFVACFAPVFVVLAVSKWGRKVFLQPLLYLYAVPAIGTFFWWRNWIEQFPSGIPANDWLFNGNGIRFRPAWFRWLGWERLTKLLLGYTGLSLFFAGLVPKNWNIRTIPTHTLIIWAWWLGLFAYSAVIATGSVQHDYYQVIWIPALCITLGQGVITADAWLSKKLSPQYSSIALVCIVGSMVLLSWQQIHGFFQVNHWEYVRAGQAVDRLVPADAKVIAPAFGDTSFLLQTNRRGWPIGFEIPDKIAKGATHYVNTSFDDETNQLMKEFTILEQTEEYVVIDLTTPKQQ